MTRARSLGLLAAGGALALPAAAQAQDEAEQITLLKTEIVVEADRLPDSPSTPAYSTVEIPREVIVASASNRLEDALGNVAGFQQFRRSDSRNSNPSAQGATLRALGGNATSRALVLHDGVPLADPFFGYIPFSAVAPETLASVRVTRGGGSGPFGGGALAGTIELESAGPRAVAPVLASGAVNTRGESELFASIMPDLGGGYVALSGRWDRGQGFFTTPEGDRVPASARAAYESWTGTARGIAYLSPETSVQARFSAWEDDRTLRFAGADSFSSGRDASVRLVSRGPWQVDALAYGQWRNFGNVVISSTRFTRVLDQRDTPSTGFGGKLEVRPPVGPDHVLRLGVDYRRSAGDLAEERYSAFSGALTGRRFAGGRTGDLGLFVEDAWTLGPLVLTGGVRLDRVSVSRGYLRDEDASGAVLLDDAYADRTDWIASWRAGARWDVAERLALRGAAYTGFRLPTLNELYRPFVVFPITTQANPDLREERLTGFEVGADWQPVAGLTANLTLFDNQVKGAIANVTIGPNLRQRQNLEAIHARGLELGVALGEGPFSLATSLAFTDAEVEASGAAAPIDGRRPAQSPRMAASATLAWEPGEGKRAALSLRHTGKQAEDDLGTDILPAATVLDAFVQWPLAGRFSLVARGENLLDEDIVTRNQGGSIDLGVPRTLWFGVRFGF